MKCYNQTKPGIRLTPDERLGPCVALGESGRGRTLTLVKLDNRRPPAVDAEGRVHEAGVVEFDAGDRKRHALTAPVPGDTRLLVRVSTETSYVRGAHGHVLTYWGEPTQVTLGKGAYGDAGRVGSWEDGLWIMPAGTALWVRPSRGDAWVIVAPVDGGAPVRWSPEAFRTEVIRGWIEQLAPDARDTAAALADLRGHSTLAAFIRSGNTVKVL